jgi:hypothetical protein
MQEVEILGTTWVGGKIKQVGDTAPVSDSDAKELFRIGRARPLLPPEEQPTALPPETGSTIYPPGHSAKHPPAPSK